MDQHQIPDPPPNKFWCQRLKKIKENKQTSKHPIPTTMEKIGLVKITSISIMGPTTSPRDRLTIRTREAMGLLPRLWMGLGQPTSYPMAPHDQKLNLNWAGAGPQPQLSGRSHEFRRGAHRLSHFPRIDENIPMKTLPMVKILLSVVQWILFQWWSLAPNTKWTHL